MILLHLGIGLLSTNVCAQAKGSAAAKPLRILAYGDSLTAGYRVAPEFSYPAQLEKLFKSAGQPVEFINGGVSGDTSAQALARIDWSLKRGPFDFVLLCIGANDGLRQLSLTNLEANIKKLIQTFEQKNIRVILVGMQLPTNFPAEYRKTFANIYPQMAKQFKKPLYPFLLDGVAQDPKLNLEDGLHPNKDGYAIIAAKLLEFLKPHLKAGQQSANQKFAAHR